MGTSAKALSLDEARLNIVARADTLPVTELERIGVARVSIASGAALAVSR
jgi:hypothetical protein